MISIHQTNTLREAISDNLKYTDYRKKHYRIDVKNFVSINSFLRDKNSDCILTIYSIMENYLESHRYFHTGNHLDEILFLIDDLKEIIHDENLLTDLRILAIFHDAIYNPKSLSNEEDSANLFKDYVLKVSLKSLDEHSESKRLNAIYQAILDTKEHNPSNELSEIFCQLDMYTISHYPFDRLLEYEHQIFKEFQYAPYKDYKLGRCLALEKLNKNYNRPEINALIQYINFRRPRIGVYCGSFKPFTIGHYNILSKAQKVFDKVIIARGKNPDKDIQSKFESNLEELFPYYQIEYFQGYIFDFLSNMESDGCEYYLVKGLRDQFDFINEQTQDRYNKHLSNIRHLHNGGIRYNVKNVCIFGDASHSHISSSAIRQMENIEPGSAKELIYKPYPFSEIDKLDLKCEIKT